MKIDNLLTVTIVIFAILGGLAGLFYGSRYLIEFCVDKLAEAESLRMQRRREVRARKRRRELAEQK